MFTDWCCWKTPAILCDSEVQIVTKIVKLLLFEANKFRVLSCWGFQAQLLSRAM